MSVSSNVQEMREPAQRVPLAKIAIATVVAIVAASIVNVLVFLLGDAAGSFPNDVDISRMNGDKGPMGVADVIGSTVFALVIAGIVFAIISRLSNRPVRIFWYVAAVAFVISLYSPFTIKDAPGDMIVVLLLMHLLSAVIGIWVLTRVARS